MIYKFQIGEKNAEITCSDDLNIEELEIVENMLSRLIDSRIRELRKQEQDKLPLTADIDSLYPELSLRARNIFLVRRQSYGNFKDSQEQNNKTESEE